MKIIDKINSYLEERDDSHKGIFSKKYGLNFAPGLPPKNICKRCGQEKRFYTKGPASDGGLCPDCADELEKAKWDEDWKKNRMKELEKEELEYRKDLKAEKKVKELDAGLKSSKTRKRNPKNITIDVDKLKPEK
jgi:hypothetical protein